MFQLCSCVPSFITLYLSHFPMYCGDKSIHNFIYFATQFCDLQGHLWIATSAVLLLMMWQNAEQKVTVELNAASAFPTWLEPLLRGSAHTCSRVSVYSRERMWSKMANIADSFPRLPPHPPRPLPLVLDRELVHSQLICSLLWRLISHETEQYEKYDVELKCQPILIIIWSFKTAFFFLLFMHQVGYLKTYLYPVSF